MDLSRTVLKDSPDDLQYSILEPAILNDFSSIRWLVSAARWNDVFTEPIR